MYKGRCSWRRTWRDVAARQNIRLDNPIKSFTHQQRISIRKQSLIPPSFRPVSPWYLLNVMKWACISFVSLLLFSSLSPIVRSPSRASYGSRKRIDNGHRHVEYTKIVCLLKKPVGSSRCRYPAVYGLYISLLLRARVRSPQKRNFLDKREHSRVWWQLYAQRKSLSSIFYSIRPGGLFRARVRKRVTLLETPVSSLSLSVERNQGPLSNLNHRRCAPKLDELVKSEKTRRAYSAVHRLQVFRRK